MLETLKTSQTLIEFIEHLMLICYPTGGVILVMVNVPDHRSAHANRLTMNEMLKACDFSSVPPVL